MRLPIRSVDGKSPPPSRWRGGGRVLARLTLALGLALGVVSAAGAQDFERIPFERIPSERAMSAVKEKEEPVYPPMAKRMGVEGVVEVDVFIDSEGKVVDAKKVSGHPVLAHSVLKSLKKWEFRPIDGKAVVTTLTLEFRQ